MQTQSQVIWVTAMVFLGTADVLIQWWNWVTLSSDQLNRGLVVGAPPKVKLHFAKSCRLITLRETSIGNSKPGEGRS